MNVSNGQFLENPCAVLGISDSIYWMAKIIRRDKVFTYKFQDILLMKMISNSKCVQTWNNRLVPNRKRSMSRLYCHPVYLTYMQSTS